MTPLDDAVIVWYCRDDAPQVLDRLPAHWLLLAGEEPARARRFYHTADTHRFVIGRALARTMLARFGGGSPSDWTFAIDAHGRPQLAERPDGGVDLHFNLSHTPGLVACAVAVGREVGVDVERADRRVTEELPERFFAAREVADLRALPADAQPRVFFDYWTLKESYIKARGLGLAIPLGQFAFLLDPPKPPRIEFAPELEDDPATWQFVQFWPTSEHRMAVAVRRVGADLPVVVEEVVP